MKITIKPTDKQIFSPLCTHPTVTVKIPQDDLTMEQVIENLIIPALLGMGFQQETIETYFNGDCANG
jgi:hypothetical protein